jgi:hypothetical protein
MHLRGVLLLPRPPSAEGLAEEATAVGLMHSEKEPASRKSCLSERTSTAITPSVRNLQKHNQ